MQNSLTMDVIEKTLYGLGVRMQSASLNVANMNTPQFVRHEVSFERQLHDIIRGPAQLPLKTSDPQHISNVTRTAAEVKPEVRVVNYEIYRGDSNNVDPETETARLTETRMMYQAMASAMGKKLRNMRRVMKTV